MKYQNLMETSRSFWRAYEQALSQPGIAPMIQNETERLRYLLVLGFTGLDAGVAAFWHARILPEWSEVLSLINIYLQSNEDFDQLKEFAGAQPTRGQLKASLRFIENTGEPEKFSPTLVDCGVLFLLLGIRSPQENTLRAAAKILFRLQKIRNAAFHVGREFNPVLGHEALLLVNKWIALGPSIHPAFELHFVTEQKAENAA